MPISCIKCLTKNQIIAVNIYSVLLEDVVLSVYLNYGLAELNLQYNPQVWSQDFDRSTMLSNAKSIEVRSKYHVFDDLSYGNRAEEKLDIVIGNAMNEAQPVPVFVFFHGGWWNQGSKQDACYPAEMILEKKGVFVAVNFAKIENATLSEIVRQSQAAVAWVYHNIADYGGNPDQIFICGKSSGAQQAGMVLATDWRKYEAPADLIKGAVLVSGIYDLEPLSLSDRRTQIGLNEAFVKELSPFRKIANLSADQACDLILVYAENDSDETKRQSVAFAESWRKAGFICAIIEETGVDHYSIAVPMGNPNSAMGRATLALMGL